MEPDGIVGHSIGELSCAYADGGLTAEETVLAAYWRGRCVSEANLPTGAMAAIGECCGESVLVVSELNFSGINDQYVLHKRNP